MKPKHCQVDCYIQLKALTWIKVIIPLGSVLILAVEVVEFIQKQKVETIIDILCTMWYAIYGSNIFKNINNVKLRNVINSLGFQNLTHISISLRIG